MPQGKVDLGSDWLVAPRPWHARRPVTTTAQTLAAKIYKRHSASTAASERTPTCDIYDLLAFDGQMDGAKVFEGHTLHHLDAEVAI